MIAKSSKFTHLVAQHLINTRRGCANPRKDALDTVLKLIDGAHCEVVPRFIVLRFLVGLRKFVLQVTHCLLALRIARRILSLILLNLVAHAADAMLKSLNLTVYIID